MKNCLVNIYLKSEDLTAGSCWDTSSMIFSFVIMMLFKVES